MALARHLVIFARLPRLGTGKRRLARDVGAAEALRLQRAMLAVTLRSLSRDRRWITHIAVTPDHSGPWPHRIVTIRQGGGDLGHRMARTARRLSPGPVVIVGCDIPDMRPGHIAKAFDALGRFDAVFGPAADGGYWLVGLKRRPHFIDPFVNVRWSSAHALADTVANLAGRKIGFIDTLTDVDDVAAIRARGLGKRT